MSSQWIVIVLGYALVLVVIGLWFYEDNKKRKVRDANRETTLAAIGMLVARHNRDDGVSAEVFSATFMLLGIHVSPQAAGMFNQLIDGNNDEFYFPENTFRGFCNYTLDSGFTVKEMLYRGDYALPLHKEYGVGC
jgi:hypothetical protein